MGTTAEKLKYLNETKAEIKNALETPYNVMRDYPELIKKYIDNQPTKVVTDGICGNAVDVPVKAIEINGNIRQETTQGKNKLDFKKILKSANVTYTEQDGVFSLAKTGSLYAVPYKLDLKPNTTYTIYQNFQEQNSTNVRLTIARGSKYEKVVESYSTTETESYRKKTFTTDENSDYYIRGDWSLSYFPLIYNKPILIEGTEDIIHYEPYTGGIPSPNPDYKQEITSVGGYDNLFDENNIISGSYVSDGKGTFVSDSTSKRTDYIEIHANSYYYIYSDKTTGNWGAWYDKDKNFISGITLGGKNEGTVNSPANAKYMAFTVSYQGNLTDYSNIKINETAIKIKQSGKNLLNVPEVLEISIFKEIEVNLEANNTYTFKFDNAIAGSDNNISRIAFRNTTDVVVKNLNTSTVKNFEIQPTQDITNIRIYASTDYSSSVGKTKTFQRLMIYEGADEASYEPYHEPIITPINLQGNILSKAGDVKDILKVNRNGEVEIKKNIEKIVLTGSEKLVEKSSSTTRTYWGIDFSNYGIYQYNDPTKVCDVLTTKFKPRPQQGSFLPGQVALITGKKNVYFIFEPDTTEEQARAILTDMPVYFRLAEPQTIKLSSISPIELWQGTNIFKLITNLDTDFEVEYVVDKDSVTKEEE